MDIKAPTSPETIEMLIAGPAALEVPVEEAAALDAELLEAAVVPVAEVDGALVMPTLARSVYNDADVYVTQLLDAAGVGV